MDQREQILLEEAERMPMMTDKGLMHTMEVSEKVVNKLTKNKGPYKDKAFGYTRKQFPVFAVNKNEEGEWDLYPLVSEMWFFSGEVILVSTQENVKSKTSDKDVVLNSLPVGTFEYKKDALEHLGAEGSTSKESRDHGKVYVVEAQHLPDNFDYEFTITERERRNIVRKTMENEEGGRDLKKIRVKN